MIVDIIKASLINIVAAGNAAYRTFTAYGRGIGSSTEIVSGKLFQHYGFRSQPKTGADLVTIQYGNNNVSVAENDGNLAPSLSDGQVAIYASGIASEQVSMVMTPNGQGDGLITIICKTGAITISAGDNVQMTLAQDKVTIKAPKIELEDSDSGLVKLLTEKFADLLANHTHALDVPHGLTLAPLQYSAGMVSPVSALLYPDAFTSVVEAK